MKNILFTYFTFFLFSGAFAQYKTIKLKADKAFDDQNYYQAAYYYDMLAGGKNKVNHNIPFYASVKKEQIKAEYPYIRYQLAESYRLYQDYRKAQLWYAKILADGDTVDYPLTRLWYGVCLRANTQFDDALHQLKQFRNGYKGEQRYIDAANQEIANCTLAQLKYASAEPVSVRRMVGSPWEGDGGSYGLGKNAGNYWFTSSRTTTGSVNAVNHIYIVRGQAAPVIVPLSSGDNKNMEYGSAFFDEANKRLYVTGRFMWGDQMISAIYYTSSQNDQWSQLQKLNTNVNADGYNAMQPFVTPDGKRLFFSSDKPGGQGGYDIWVSNLDADGNAADAVNAGKVVNTPSDDEAPSYDVMSKTLYYSSKGFVGVGGFDVYESKEKPAAWSVPVNLGYPVNSSKDDLYYFTDPENNGKFYLSSDRESECCLALFAGIRKPLVITGILSACDTSMVLAGAKVKLADSLSGKLLAQAETGLNGRYSFQLAARTPYKLTFEKQGYFTKSIIGTAPGKDTLITENPCLEGYLVNKPIVIKNILYDFNKATLRPESLVALDGLVTIMRDNPAIIIELSSHTDSIGRDAYNLKLSQQRAQSCVDYILSKGIGQGRVVAKGYGKTMPVAPNSMPNGKDNPAGRQLNRRTEFKVTGQKQ